MTCGICGFVGPPSHDARRCPLSERLCRHSLPIDHEFFLASPCMTHNCVCKKVCTTCYAVGHQTQTQSFVSDRWRMGDGGAITRKTPRRGVEVQDFACPKMTVGLMNILIQGAKTSATNSAVRRSEMDAAAVRLRQNSLQSGLGDLKDVVVVLEAQGSPAALLEGANRPAFDALTAGIDDGAVTANLRAAAAMEDQTGLEPVETSVGGAMSAALSTDEGEPSPRPSRIQDYAAAIARQRTRAGMPSRAASRKEGLAATRTPRPVSASPGPQPLRRSRAVLRSLGHNVDGPVEPVEEPTPSAWPAGTREAFSSPLPHFFSASFSRLSPVLVAHRVSLSLFCASDLEGADGRLTAFFVGGATRFHVRGFVLLSGSVSAAQVADWLCCDIPSDEQPSMLPSVAAAVQKVHAVASGAAASSV
ncbi:hypothetical protein I4F81_004915 [Pyropia yezoensis]|uniref:Uncharacterized protein n=1 Tax=Pyropia yezoensis TaxID=2788 RepID=A0ACC3BXY9_PYRYE|nr:hypothetical protein I4F81_004915 [Neopyropia yezoensis]